MTIMKNDKVAFRNKRYCRRKAENKFRGDQFKKTNSIRD